MPVTGLHIDLNQWEHRCYLLLRFTARATTLMPVVELAMNIHSIHILHGRNDEGRRRNPRHLGFA